MNVNYTFFIFCCGLIALGICALWGILFAYSAPIGLVLLVVLAFGLATFIQPLFGVSGLVVSTALGVLGDVGESGIISIFKLVTFMMICLWLLRALLIKDTDFIAPFQNPMAVCLLLFLLLNYLSIIYATNRVSSIYYLIRLTAYTAFYFLITFIVREKKGLKWFLVSLLCVCGILCLLGSYELVAKKSILSLLGYQEEHLRAEGEGEIISSLNKEYATTAEAEWARIRTTFHDPPAYGAYLVVNFGILVVWLFHTKGFKKKFFLFAFLGLLIANLIGTGSRGALLGFMVASSMLVLLLKFPAKKPILIISIILFLIALPVINLLFPQYRAGFSSEAFEEDPRAGIWTTALNIIEQHPLLGVGIGNFSAVYYVRYRPPTAPFKPYLNHNVFLQAWSETGIASLICLSLFFFFQFFSLFRIIRKTSDPFLHDFATGILASVSGYFMFCLIANPLENDTFWLVNAATAAITQIYKKESLSERQVPELVQDGAVEF